MSLSTTNLFFDIISHKPVLILEYLVIFYLSGYFSANMKLQETGKFKNLNLDFWSMYNAM